MSNSMIQNSISQRKAGTMNTPASHTSGRNIDYRHLQVGARPFAPKGKLVKGSLLGVQETVDEFKYLKKGLTGEANDHNLGKINDLTMKAGALGIAGYLATKRGTPVKKGMEFVGAGTFFATMALWPKIFIQAPIQALYGFNVNQKWEDSIGRKNDFFRDPQYTPWDIMPAEKIEKVGDKMGVPTDMKDRQSLIKDRMKKTAIQSNTLWMLTAGIASPVLGALAACAVEKPLSNLVEKMQTAKVEKKFANIDETVDSKTKNYENKKLVKLLDSNKGEKVDAKLLDDIVGHLETEDVYMNNRMRENVSSMIGYKKQEKVGDLYKDILKNDTFKQLGVTKETLDAKLKKANLSENVELTPDNRKDIKRVLGLFWSNPESDGSTKDIAKDAREALIKSRMKKDGLHKRQAAHQVRDEFFALCDKATEDNTATLTQEHIDAIKKVSKATHKFDVRRSILSDFQSHYIGEREDTIVARRWKQSTDKIMKAMGFDDKELHKARTSSDAAYEIMDQKLTKLTEKGNEAQFEKVMGQVVDAVRDFEDAIHEKKFGKEGKQASFQEHVTKQANKMFDETAKAMKEAGLVDVADYLVGAPEKGLEASAKSNFDVNLKNTMDGSLNSMYKFIHAMDIYKKIGSEKTPATKLMKRIALDARMSDHIVKFDIKNSDTYKEAVNRSYGSLDASTEKVLKAKGDTHTGSKLKGIMQKTVEDLVNRLDDFNQSHNMDGSIDIKDGDNWWKAHQEAKMGLSGKQARLGESVSQMFKQAAEPVSNTKKWIKMFGGIGVGIAAVTLIAPVFFGKIKPKQEQVSNGGAQ